MNISLILAHPNPESLNHAIAQQSKNYLEKQGHTVFYHDLYQEQFDPNLPFEEFEKDAALPDEVQTYCDELIDSEGLILVHPNWWGMPPAILKGWVDRVIRPGVAYQFDEGDSGEGVPKGLLKAKATVVFNTSNTSEYRETNVFGDPLENLWKTCILDFCGIQQFYRKMFRIVVTSTLEERQAWLMEVEEMLEKAFG